MESWDPYYFLSLVSFLVGGASGFQGIYETYRKDSPRVAVTLPGFFYLISRGAVPSILFLLLYSRKIIEDNLFIWALACGTGVELILRSKISIKQTQEQGGNIQELLRGPLDLLRWYEALFLEYAAASIGERRKQFIERNLPKQEFLETYRQIYDNIYAWPQEITRREIEGELEKLKIEFENDLIKIVISENDKIIIEQRYRLLLGYKLLNIVGQRGFRTLFPPPSSE
jgi:hypothetical protein